jgi:hypothetical protein
MRLDNGCVRDLVGGKGTDFLLVGRVVDPFLRSLDGGLALFEGSGQLAVEVGSVAELGVGSRFLRRRRTSVRCEIRPLQDWNEHDGRKEKVGTYRVQIREREMGVLVRELSESG